MKSIIVKLALLAMIAGGFLPASAQPGDKGKQASHEKLDRAQAKAEKVKRKTQNDSDELARDSKESIRESAGKGDRDRDRDDHAKYDRKRDRDDDNDRDDDGDRDRADRGADEQNENATEALARRDERKAIKESYQADVKAGGERVKGKKPWYQFWGDDDEED